MNGNGNAQEVKGRDGGVQRITITEQPGSRKMALDIDCLALDTAIGLLERAARELDARYRFERAQELLAAKIEQQRIASIAQDAMLRGPRG